MTEIWRDIEGYEGLYQVSNLGRVRSLDRTVVGKNRWGGLRERTFKGQILKQFFTHYWMVDLCKDGNSKKYLTHRLEWTAFYGPIPEGMQINHIDENPHNNTLDNLSLATPSENVNWGTRNERDRLKKLGKKGKLNINNQPIIQYTIDGKFIKEYPSVKQAQRETGYKYIYDFKRRPNNIVYGYRWEYKEKKAS